MDLTVQECPDGQNNRFGAEFEPHLGNCANDTIVLHDKIFHCLLEDHQVRLVLQGSTHRLTIKHAVCLSAGRTHSGAFTGV